MPVDRDVIESRIRDVMEVINELKRITSKSFNEMSIDEIYSMRYNIIVLVEALASICIHIANTYIAILHSMIASGFDFQFHPRV
jgi:uncharacterized protein YutE (UPF0331/DUF86 family)